MSSMNIEARRGRLTNAASGLICFAVVALVSAPVHGAAVRSQIVESPPAIPVSASQDSGELEALVQCRTILADHD